MSSSAELEASTSDTPDAQQGLKMLPGTNIPHFSAWQMDDVAHEEQWDRRQPARKRLKRPPPSLGMPCPAHSSMVQ